MVKCGVTLFGSREALYVFQVKKLVMYVCRSGFNPSRSLGYVAW
mgnify:FL=1